MAPNMYTFYREIDRFMGICVSLGCTTNYRAERHTNVKEPLVGIGLSSECGVNKNVKQLVRFNNFYL